MPRGGEVVQLYSFFKLGARWCGCSTPRPVRFNPREDPVPIVKEAELVSGPDRTGAENLAPPPTVIRFPDHPTRNQSLYRLQNSGPTSKANVTKITSKFPATRSQPPLHADSSQRSSSSTKLKFQLKC
jgi:hypothetical protein